MLTEKFSNNATTTLNGSIDNSQTTLVVMSGTLFPVTGQFRLLIDSEILIVTSVSGTTYTVTRAAENTTGASHSNGANVLQVFTEGAVNQLVADILQKGAFASLPSAEKAGRLYLSELQLLRDNGTIYDPYGPLFKFKAPVDGDFAWINQLTNADVITTNGGIYLFNQDQTSGEEVVLRKKSLPSAPYQITLGFIPNCNPTCTFFNCGLMLRESSSGKLLCINVINRGGAWKIENDRWLSPTFFSAITIACDMPALGPMVWFRIIDDNTNRTYLYSSNGVNFVKIGSESRTTFITADEVGFYVNNYGPNSSGFESGITVLHWEN